jgi:succinate dehydrogenase flavin-adding protein (antitoxin of CptAB toxin-antitoxin module)
MNDFETPLPVLVALLPSTPTRDAASSRVPGEFQTAITRFNKIGKPLCAAEHTKYLLEEACPERWLIPLVKRAGGTNGVVKLCYGCGYETIVVVGNAEAREAPTGQLAVGLTVNRANATINEIGKVWVAGSENVWCFVAGSNGGNLLNEQPCLFICTSSQRFMIPALPEKELAKRKRMIRVWPASEDANVIEKMEEIKSQNHELAAVSRICAPPAVVATSRSKGSVSKPKKPATLFNIFMKQNRKRVSDENPGASFSALSKLLSDEFNQLTKEELKEYEPLVEADKKRFDEEMKVWTAAGNFVQVDNKNKVKRDPNMPRQGKTTYNFFMEANRGRVIAENPNAKDYKEIQQKLTEEYRSLSDEEMAKYIAMSKKDKETQDKAIAEYISQRVLDGDGEQPKQKKKKDANAPKNPKNAYLFFSSEQRPIVKAANPDASFGELGRLVGIAYKSLSEEEMAKYEELAAADKERYWSEMKEYKIKEGNSCNGKTKDDDGNKKPAAISREPVAEKEQEDSDSDSSSDEESDSSSDEDSESSESSSSSSASNPKKRKSTEI